MLCAEDVPRGEGPWAPLEEAPGLLLHNCRGLNASLSRFGYRVYGEYCQAVYTRRETVPLPHKEIRLLTVEELPYLIRCCEQAQDGGEPAEYVPRGDIREYLTDRLKSRALYGVYVEERPVGFAGWNREGSIGCLYVEPACRRRKLGASLTAFMVNQALEQGRLPYAHIAVTNEAAKCLVESMGFYRAGRTVFWMGKDVFSEK
ncbi:MAG: GNAT family N-acetyltransferase [Roseburia sp.]|nr:GNAT family N-acetyltransferase [Roseburia sp.]